MAIIYGFMLSLFFYLVYKIRFKNFNRLKIYFFRKWINFKYKYSKIGKKRIINQPLTDRGIKIWKICTKDKRSELNFSYISKARQIKLGELYLIFTEDEYERGTIKIYNNTSGCNSYFECYINKNNFEDVADYFDLEVEKRIRVIDNHNKNKVLHSMDELIETIQK
jgi:hypothetical protein